MKKLFFSGLISCGLFLMAAQTTGQITSRETTPAADTEGNHPAFYATIRNDDAGRQVVILHWSTRDVANVDRYVIQKSTDSILFNPLQEIKPQTATDATADSIYRDEDPFPAGQSNFSNSTNFYRLATIFKGGNKQYSSVIRVNVPGAQTPLLRPVLLNVNGVLRMDNFYQQPLIVILYDEGGARIATYTANSASFNINTANLNGRTITYTITDEHRAFLNAGKILLQ
jgi:hypothetical protein